MECHPFLGAAAGVYEILPVEMQECPGRDPAPAPLVFLWRGARGRFSLPVHQSGSMPGVCPGMPDVQDVWQLRGVSLFSHAMLQLKKETYYLIPEK